MVAQGATVAVLIASAGLSRVSFDDEAEVDAKPEEQWKQMVSTSLWFRYARAYASPVDLGTSAPSATARKFASIARA